MSADTDTAARQRIAEVTTVVMQKAAESLNTMVNQIITSVREDEKFLGAILTPGVDLNLDLQVPDALEHKIMVLIAECVSQDRVETLDAVLNEMSSEHDDWTIVKEALDAAEKEAAEIAAAADEVRAAPAAKAAEETQKGPGIVLPEGLVRCPECGGAATPLSKCARCGQDVGIKL